MSLSGASTRSTSSAAGHGTTHQGDATHHQPYRQGKATGTSLGIARARYALWTNPGDLTDNQRTQLEWIAKTNPRLPRAAP